jgi:hypothetical protein
MLGWKIKEEGAVKLDTPTGNARPATTEEDMARRVAVAIKVWHGTQFHVVWQESQVV